MNPRRPTDAPPPDVCPVCGSDVPEDAVACPGCGADETTGWSEMARDDALDLPEESFDYDTFVQEEFGGGRKRSRAELFWAGVAWAVLGALLCWLWWG